MSGPSPIDPKTLRYGDCVEFEWSVGGERRRDPSGIFLGSYGEHGAEIGWDDGTAMVFTVERHDFKIVRAWNDPTALARWRSPGAWPKPTEIP
ncbi:MAG TPA: hypothetical protein VF257_19610 [Solirubrobacteraceae bacterium]